MNQVIEKCVMKRFMISRLDEALVTNKTGAIFLDVELDGITENQQVFVGVLNPDLDQGIGIVYDPASGAIVDAINERGKYVGYVGPQEASVTKPLSIKMSLDIEKFGNVYIPVVKINGERLLHKAVRIDGASDITSVVGSTVGKFQERVSVTSSELTVWEDNGVLVPGEVITRD